MFFIYSKTSNIRHPLFRQFLLTVMVASHCVWEV